MPKREPVRVFEGNARPYEPFWTVRSAAESESGEAELEFYGFISEYSWFEDDVTPKKFRDDLNRVGAGGPVTIRMNSGGGEVFAASVIRSIIMEYPGQVTVRIDGLCASAATFVATAGDVVKMQDTAFFMIHDPSAIAWGTIDEIKRVLDLLKTVKDGIIDAYQAKTQMDPARLAKLMSAETWMTAKEARDLGFVDEVISSSKKTAAASMAGQAAITNALRNFQNVPAELLKLTQQPEPDNQPAEPPDVSRLRAEVKLLF